MFLPLAALHFHVFDLKVLPSAVLHVRRVKPRGSHLGSINFLLFRIGRCHHSFSHHVVWHLNLICYLLCYRSIKSMFSSLKDVHTIVKNSDCIFIGVSALKNHIGREKFEMTALVTDVGVTPLPN